METITLKRGESYTVTLPGLGSAGYKWSLDSADPRVVKVEEIMHAKGSVAQPVTGSLDQRFKLTAIAPGHTIVRFIRSRPFARAEKPNATFELSLAVKG